jgi:hypothetical protein
MTTRILNLFLICLFVSATWAQSSEIKKPVPPITSEAVGADKSKSDAGNKKFNPDNLPPSIDVKIGGKLEIYSEECKGEADTESNKWTDPISIFTGMLVVVTGILAVFTYLLWDSTAEASARQAKEMKEPLVVSNRSAKIAEDGVALARLEFFATHRPRLAIRRVEFLVASGNVPLGIRYSVHNAGDSEGVITAVSERLWLDNGATTLHVIPTYRPPKTENVSLKSGEHIACEYIHPEGEELGFASVTFSHLGAHDRKPIFLGYIEYIDQAGMTRRTAFLREYDPATRRFNQVNHPDYEYQE